jgi:hypothetical protein
MASIASALSSLAPTASFAVHGNEYENIIWQSDTPMPTKEAVLAEVARLQIIDNANAYKEKRQQAYPSIPDQLDLIYHQGLDAWKAAIEAVKQEYPKP